MGLLTLLSPPGAIIKASSGPRESDMPERIGKTWHVDPFAYMESLSHRDRPSMLSYDQLRIMAARTDVVNAILQTRVNQVAAFAQPATDRYSIGFSIQMRDGSAPGSRAATNMALQLSREIMSCGMPGMARDGFESFLRKFTRDSLIYDQACAEVIPRRNGVPAFFEAVDASTIRMAASPADELNEMGHKDPRLDAQTPFQQALQQYHRDLLVQQNGQQVPAKYVQLINGTVRTTYTEDELFFGVRNPRTDLSIAGYGMSELEVLVGVITSYLYAEEYNRRIFSQGSIPKGILNLKGEITDQQLQAFKREWTTLIAGVQNAWKTPVLNAEDIEYINLQTANKDMEYMQWIQFLVRIACFTPDTPVVLADGSFRPIAEVQAGDMVRTHSGRVGRVKNLQVTSGKDRVIGIRASGETIKATPEHPFYVATSTLHSDNSRTLDEPEWVEAKDLVAGRDYLAVPKPQGEALSTTAIDLSTYVDCRVEETTIRPHGNRSYAIPRYIPLTEDNTFVLGLFAAEGHADDSTVTFAFHRDEVSYSEAVMAFANRMGLQAEDWTQKPNSLTLRIRSSALARALKALFGDCAATKKIPSEIVTAPLSAQQAFLSGVIGGDGSVPRSSRNRAEVHFESASPVLTQQVQSMLLRQGVYAGRYSRVRRTGFKPQSESITLRMSAGQAAKVSQWLSGPKGDLLRDLVAAYPDSQPRVYETDAYFYVPVTETWEEPYDGLVYNLEVEGEHTYQVNHFAVHNCAVYLIDPAEINFDMPRGLDSSSNPMIEANNDGKLKASKDRGLSPLLRFIQRAINEMYVYRIDPDFEFRFVGLDARTIEQQQSLAIQGVSSYRTLNEVRAMEDLAPLPNGDMPLNPVYVQALQAQQQMAMQAEMAKQQEAAQEQQADAEAEEADKQRDHEKDIATIEAKADVESAKHQAKAATSKSKSAGPQK